MIACMQFPVVDTFQCLTLCRTRPGTSAADLAVFSAADTAVLAMSLVLDRMEGFGKRNLIKNHEGGRVKNNSIIGILFGRF